MQEIQSDVARFLSEGQEVALAQVFRTLGSSPRRPGSVMAVAADGRLAGSVSGGCVEGSVIQSALECLETGERRVEAYRASQEDPEADLEVGLACGGSLDVLISRLQPALFAAECEEIRQGREYVRVTSVSGENAPELDFLMTREDSPAAGLFSFPVGAWQVQVSVKTKGQRALLEEAAAGIDRCLSRGRCLKDGNPGSRILTSSVFSASNAGTGEIECGGYGFFYHRVRPKPKLICVGGVHISVHLTRLAKSLGYRTIVIDPRGIFSTEERFPWVDELWKEWPQQAFSHLRLDGGCALCALSHDPKIDVPALAAALRSPAFYIGCLGRTTTQWDRCQALLEEGFSEEELQRVYGPIGLDLGGREPAEIALSILSEITMVRYGGNLPTRTLADSARLGRAERENAAVIRSA